MRKTIPFLLATLFFNAFVVCAQDDDDVVRVNTDLVVLNVTVTDKAGQYVKALKKSDFKINEDGVEVTPDMISSFSVHESPYAAVVLLDSSGSMEARFSLARSAAIRFLDGLRPEDVAAIAYAIHAKGMTTLNDPIVEASKTLAERPEQRKAIVVLSDGVDTFSKASSSKAVESALAVGATIYAVDMSSLEIAGSERQQSAASLRGFAEKTGGRFVATPGGPAMRDAFTQIAEELGHQYTIAYRPVNKKHDGKWRALEVKVAREDLTVRTRKGYRAPKK